MYKLRFIRNWGTFKPGDEKETESSETARALVQVYKRAELLPGSDPIPAESVDAFDRLTGMPGNPSILVGPDGKSLQ